MAKFAAVHKRTSGTAGSVVVQRWFGEEPAELSRTAVFAIRIIGPFMRILAAARGGIGSDTSRTNVGGIHEMGAVIIFTLSKRAQSTSRC